MGVNKLKGKVIGLNSKVERLKKAMKRMREINQLYIDQLDEKKSECDRLKSRIALLKRENERLKNK